MEAALAGDNLGVHIALQTQRAHCRRAHSAVIGSTLSSLPSLSAWPVLMLLLVPSTRTEMSDPRRRQEQEQKDPKERLC